MSSSTENRGLQELNARIAEDLAVLDYPARSGLLGHNNGEDVLNVAIIGGGQSALGIAAGLKLEKIDSVKIFEREPRGKAGPWRRFARMHTLRTPKNLPGPNWGIPNLSFRRWYEARGGDWDALRFIDKEDWASYLDWYRDVLNLNVQYESEVESVVWDEGTSLFVLGIARYADGGRETLKARRVVLATGIEGSGQWQTPDFIKDNVPAELWSHTSEDIDFSALAGKRVGVLGAGASAFDNAAVSLESGAARVDLCFRRKELVRVNTFRWAEYMEFLKHFPNLDDRRKWEFMWKIIDIGQLPPHDTYHRAMAHDGFNLRPGTSWDEVSYRNGEILVTSGDNQFRYDYIIAATGFRTDLHSRPEITGFSDQILRWTDVFTPDSGMESAELSRHPYLGENFQFLPANREENHWISKIYNYTYGGILSLGFGGASITGMKYSLPRVVSGITGSFFKEDNQAHYKSLYNYDVEEF